jgi:hypothetical protein
MLTQERRQQLDNIVLKLHEKKASSGDVQIIVNDFIKKYNNENVQQPTQKTGLLQKTSNVLGTIFGGEKIGEAIGTKIAQMTVPEDQKQFVPAGPKPIEVAGDVAGIGLTVAGLKGVGTAGKFVPRLLKSIGLGAGISGAETVSEGGSISDIAKSATAGGVVGGALPIIGAGLNSVGKQIDTLPARFVNSALNRNKAQVLKDIATDKTDDLAKFVIEKKPIGTATQLLSESQNNIQALNNKIGNSLSSAIDKTGNKVSIGVNDFLDEVTKIPEAQGALLNRNDVKLIIEKLAPQTKQLLGKTSLTLEEANKLRQLTDRTLGDRAFLGGQLSSDKIVLKKFADFLRETVKSKAPEGTRELFKELSNEIQFSDGLLNKIAQKQGNQVLSFGDFIGGGLGGVFGGGIPGVVAGVATRRAIESVPFKITSAKLINALTKAGPVLEKLSPAQQTVLLNLFSEIVTPDKPTDKSNQ